MIYFIGGAPRVGKTQIAKKIAEKLSLSLTSTDALRWGAFQLNQIPLQDNLFVKKRLGE